jgi:hypothetical protein
MSCGSGLFVSHGDGAEREVGLRSARTPVARPQEADKRARAARCGQAPSLGRLAVRVRRAFAALVALATKLPARRGGVDSKAKPRVGEIVAHRRLQRPSRVEINQVARHPPVRLLLEENAPAVRREGLDLLVELGEVDRRLDCATLSRGDRQGCVGLDSRSDRRRLGGVIGIAVSVSTAIPIFLETPSVDSTGIEAVALTSTWWSRIYRACASSAASRGVLPVP